MMATYFHGGSEIQATTGTTQDHNLQTLYLMNPNFITAYSESQTPSNMLFLNASNTLSHQGSLPHAPPPPPPHQQQFIGIPLSGSHPSEDNHGRPSPSSSGSLQHHQIPAALHGLSVSRIHPNLWGQVGNPSTSQPSPIQNTVSGPDMVDQMGFRRPVTAQGLSLSLSPGQQQNQSQVTVVAGGSSNSVAGSNNGVIIGSKYLKAAQELLEEVVNVGGNCSGNNNNVENRIICGESSGVHKDKAKVTMASPRDHSVVGEGRSHGGSASVGGGGCGGGESSGGCANNNKNKAIELSTAQKQELQLKKAKLLNMLDEVEQRYRQYNSEMQVVVASFEQAAGIGSAKLYTSLALKTISKQFRCLKDAIMSQIKATSKSLGEEDCNINGTGVKLEEGVAGSSSRLRFVDHQLRQQRALQQLGMMQHNAWRPQRGLPERAVSVLRAWLFEHFLHPYPKDSDKHMLAKQTGLTRSQVSNWFINARVRLWKPMVEEMYLEEIKTQEHNGANSDDTNTNTTTKNKTSNSPKNDPSTTNNTIVGHQQHEQHQDHGSVATIQPPHQQPDHTTNDMISNLSAMSTTSPQGFTLIGSSSDMESLMASRSPKKQRSNSDLQNSSPSSILSMDMEIKPVDHHNQRHSSFLMGNHGDPNPGFNPYIAMNDIAERFNPGQMTAHPYHGNAVSLTLGLPHCENNLSLGNHHHHNQHDFLPSPQGIQLGRRLDIGGAGESEFCGISMAQPSHPNNGYESIDIQNRKRFAAHLLHDFVA